MGGCSPLCHGAGATAPPGHGGTLDGMSAQPGEPVNEVDRPLPAYYRRMKGSSASVALGAAMVAVGEILEPSKTSVEIAQPADDERGDDGFDLRFGSLPDLD